MNLSIVNSNAISHQYSSQHCYEDNAFISLLQRELVTDYEYLTNDKYASFIASTKSLPKMELIASIIQEEASSYDSFDRYQTLPQLHDQIQILAHRLRDKYYLLLDTLKLTQFEDLLPFASISNRDALRTSYTNHMLDALIEYHNSATSITREDVVEFILNGLMCSFGNQTIHPDYTKIRSELYKLKGIRRQR